MNTPNAADFGQWLGAQLHQHASAHAGPSPLPAQALYRAAYVKGAVHVPLLAKVGAALTTKVAIGVTAGVLAVAAAGVGESVITGSVNPSDWGKQVVKQVHDCKATLAPNSHGIGECVSSFASQHGKTVSAEHRTTPTPGHGDNTPGPPAGKGKPTDRPTQQSRPHPTPPGRHK